MVKQLRKDKEDLKIKSSEFESTAAKLKESEELAEKRKITSDNLAKEVIPNLNYIIGDRLSVHNHFCSGFAIETSVERNRTASESKFDWKASCK